MDIEWIHGTRLHGITGIYVYRTCGSAGSWLSPSFVFSSVLQQFTFTAFSPFFYRVLLSKSAVFLIKNRIIVENSVDFHRPALWTMILSGSAATVAAVCKIRFCISIIIILLSSSFVISGKYNNTSK